MGHWLPEPFFRSVRIGWRILRVLQRLWNGFKNNLLQKYFQECFWKAFFFWTCSFFLLHLTVMKIFGHYANFHEILGKSEINTRVNFLKQMILFNKMKYFVQKSHNLRKTCQVVSANFYILSIFYFNIYPPHWYF